MIPLLALLLKFGCSKMFRSFYSAPFNKIETIYQFSKTYLGYNMASSKKKIVTAFLSCRVQKIELTMRHRIK